MINVLEKLTEKDSRQPDYSISVWRELKSGLGRGQESYNDEIDTVYEYVWSTSHEGVE